MVETREARGWSARPPNSDCVPRGVFGVKIVGLPSIDPDLERSIDKLDLRRIIFIKYADLIKKRNGENG